METLLMTEIIARLKDGMLSEPRYASIEQAKIITETYQANEDKPRIIQRARTLKAALERIEISFLPDELIVGNRTAGVRYGVVFPESGSDWVDREFETLPTRPQDRFQVKVEDISYFREVIRPYWEDKSLEDVIRQRYGKEIDKIAKVVKINQKDHAQGHICPDCKTWLKRGAADIKREADTKLNIAHGKQKDFFESISIVMTGATKSMVRYHGADDSDSGG